MNLFDEIYTTFRLEPQNISYSIEENLSAPIKDPLWMLGRQWQMAEFTAEDGGLPVSATTQFREVEADKINFPSSEEVEREIPDNSPLEKEIESQTLAWNPQKLGYEFNVNHSSFKLTSKDYLGDNLDWYHFDLERFQTTGALQTVLSSLTPISYPGMPHPRWWRYENGDVNLRQLSHPQINNLSMLLTEFAFIYGQDWYQVPLKYTLGSLRKVESLIITDSFGVEITAQVITDNSLNDSGFEMFCPEKASSVAQVNSNQLFYLPNNAWHTQRGVDLEQITFLRDETSNSIWAIENIITDSGNKQINRSDTEEMEPSQANNIHDTPTYKQQILPPRHWIPYVQPLDSLAGMLRRAKTYQDPQESPPKTQALGKILNESKYIDQDQISRLGIQISRNKQLARKPDDTLVVWESRTRAISPYTPQNPIHFDEVLQPKE